ncbi:hypothetical protein GGX14DRAFT_422682 [Mycena pura]|uniref:Uncharacterized protein n=1 Tax=Mycena pura TaxID=153505 RepID=A0AAD6YPZ6_9AGAR|nr:hypothetical protein GGX14DRAFT_422682 [Mycena pura]
MFKASITAFLATLSLSSMAAASIHTPVLFNGQNITFDYSDVFLPASNLFGMGALRTGAAIPDTVVSDLWEGPVVLNIFDQDEIPATYVLMYPFFQNGSSYTVRLFEYDATTLKVAVPNVRNSTFVWVNRPGQDV